MRFFRGMAYALIALCAILCIVIITYTGSHGGGNVSATPNDSSISVVVVENGEVSFDDVIEAAGVIISDVKEGVKEVVSSVAEKASEAKENTSGEISYAEIVRLQEEEVALQQKADVSASNAANGIVIASSDKNNASTSTSAIDKKYNYAVNKTTGKIHRVGCILEPTGSNVQVYETLTEVYRAGYSEKCTICSP